MPTPEELDVIALQTRLRFSPDIASIRANCQQIKTVRDALQNQLKIVDALAGANRAMCTHPNRTTYNDPRDPGGWDCADCGGGG